MIVGDFYFSDRRIKKWLESLTFEIVDNGNGRYYPEFFIDLRLAYLLKILYGNLPNSRIYDSYKLLDNGKFKHLASLVYG